MMQLPPADARHEEAGLTFGEIRQRMMEASSLEGAAAEAAMALGCSRKLQGRELMDTECPENSIYCWHRCMNFTDTANPTVCGDQGKQALCVNQFDQLYVSGHGDYSPQCSDSTEQYTPRPVVEQPAEGSCADADFQALLDEHSDYTTEELATGETYLLWKLVDEEMHMVMAHKGRAGWLSVGFENVGGYHNGMNGAPVVMGRFIEDQSLMTVAEYLIHPKASAFRVWKDPLSPSALKDTAFTVTGCHSVLKFTTKSIYNQAFEPAGLNRLIWGLTHRDYPTDTYGGYSGYHSATDGDRTQRPRFRGHVNITTGGYDLDTSAAGSHGLPLVLGTAAAVLLAALHA